MKDPDTPHHAPPGVYSVEVMTIVPGDPRIWGAANESEAHAWAYRKNETYLARKAALEDDMIARLDRVFPGAGAGVVYRETATPLTHSRYTRARGGTGYGIAATPGQFMRHRPGYVGPIEGLFLCGASTRAGHGILGAMTSGWKAASHVGRALSKRLPSLPDRADG